MGVLSESLNTTEQTLLQAADEDEAVNTKLDSLTADAQKLELTVQELLDQVEFIKNSDVRGEVTGSRFVVRACDTSRSVPYDCSLTFCEQRHEVNDVCGRRSFLS